MRWTNLRVRLKFIVQRRWVTQAQAEQLQQLFRGVHAGRLAAGDNFPAEWK